MIRREWDALLERLPRAAAPADLCMAREASAVDVIRREPHAAANPAVSYETVFFRASDGEELSARVIRPAKDEPFPVVIMYHDRSRPVRGWHHMTRFAALGYGVFALQNRADGAPAPAVSDALTAVRAAEGLFGEPSPFVAWGEGLGATLAIAASALAPERIVKCAALNPLCTDEWQACAAYASMLRCEFLMGTSGMDAAAPPKAQCAVYAAAACPKRHELYPKYAHERVNAFEDRVLAFLHPDFHL